MADKVAELSIGVNVDTSGLSKLADSIANGKAEYEDFAQAVVKSSYKAEEAIEILKEKYKEVWKSLGEAESYEERAELLKKSKNIREAIQKLTENSKLLNAQQKQLSENTKNVADNLGKEDDKLKRLTTSTIKFLGQYFAIKKTFSAVMGFAKEGEELARMADLSGMSAQGIERLGIALKNYGGSASSASATLSKLNQQMQDLRFGKGGKLGQVAIRYGLNLNASTPEQMLLNIAKRMEGLGATQQVAMGRMIGLDNATLLLVQQGVEGVRKELEKASELSVYSEEDVKNSQKMNREYREMQERLKILSSITARSLMPLFETLFDRVSNLAKALAKYPNLLKVIGSLGFLAFAKWTGFLSPALIVIGLLVAGIGLLIDDLTTFLNGGESFIDWKPIVDGAKQLKDDISDILSDFIEIFKTSEKFQVVWDVIKETAKTLAGWVMKIMNGIGGVIAAAVVWAQGGSWQEMKDAFKASVFDEPATPSAMEIGARHVATADAFAGNTMTSNSIMSSSYTNNPIQNSYNVGKMELSFPGVTSKSVVDGAVYSIGQGIASNFGDTKK